MKTTTLVSCPSRSKSLLGDADLFVSFYIQPDNTLNYSHEIAAGYIKMYFRKQNMQ